MTQSTKSRSGSSLTREQILARARAATANDPPQVVGYTDRELALRESHRETIERLRELRALWARGASERPAVVPPPPAPEPAPEPDDAAPPTRPSAGCGLEPPPDLHEPFPLTRVRRRPAAPRQGSSGPSLG